MDFWTTETLISFKWYILIHKWNWMNIWLHFYYMKIWQWKEQSKHFSQTLPIVRMRWMDGLVVSLLADCRLAQCGQLAFSITSGFTYWYSKLSRLKPVCRNKESTTILLSYAKIQNYPILIHVIFCKWKIYYDYDTKIYYDFFSVKIHSQKKQLLAMFIIPLHNASLTLLFLY